MVTGIYEIFCFLSVFENLEIGPQTFSSSSQLPLKVRMLIFNYEMPRKKLLKNKNLS